MSIDPRYVSCADLQEYLVDKQSGLPLAGGYVYFYQDNSRTTLQSVYEISGDAPNYTFTPLPNPVVLSPVGTFMDNNGNDIVPYYLPYLVVNGVIMNEPSLYYVVVQNSNGVPQFTRQSWPPNSYVNSGAAPSIQTDFNYIPNGQFLAHNIVPNNTITQVSTSVAPGGWVFNIENSVSSTNLITFTPVGTWTEDPPQSPEYEINIACTTPNTGETYKALSATFNDVNKFSNGDQYTFGFWGISNAGNIDVTVNINKNFGVGGSSFIPVEQEVITLTSTGTFFSIPINFGLNAGLTIGTGTTTVSIDLSFSTALTFNVNFTDFVLIAGSTILSDFPAQTNADMLTRSINGWCNTPNYMGQDLYLPQVSTLAGMQYDHTRIGRVEASAGKVAHPNDALSATPPPIGNDMPCDGSTYIYANYSTLGIPFSRLGNYFLSNSAVATIPMFGTGTNFATAYAQTNTASLRLTVNSNGAGITAASDVSSGLAFTTIPVYNGSSTGSTSIGYIAYSNVADTLLAVGNFTTPNAAASDGPGANATGFTITTLSIETGIVAQQFYALTILTVAATSLAHAGNTGKYWLFSNATTNYYMWFKLTNETDPAVAGATGIQVNLQSTDSAQDVANIVRETMGALQQTNIICSTPPAEGSYFNFQTNPSSTINYFAWYSYLANSTAPVVAGRIGIKVFLAQATPTNAQVITATQTAINQYQYAAPDFRGMFLRGTDFTGIYDVDVAQRWSSISGLSGANYGTFEFQQILSHYHLADLINGATPVGNGGTATAATQPTQNTGGSETRPVNAYVNWIIKY